MFIIMPMKQAVGAEINFLRRICLSTAYYLLVMCADVLKKETDEQKQLTDYRVMNETDI